MDNRPRLPGGGSRQFLKGHSSGWLRREGSDGAGILISHGMVSPLLEPDSNPVAIQLGLETY